VRAEKGAICADTPQGRRNEGLTASTSSDINMRDLISPLGQFSMTAVTVRGLSPETHRALKARARRHDRSTEAEIRAILDAAVRVDEEVGIGTALQALGRRFRGVELDIRRDPSPARPVSFE